VRLQIDSFTIAILVIVLIVGINAAVNRTPRTIEVFSPPPAPVATSTAAQPPVTDPATGNSPLPPAVPTEDVAQAAIIAPYDNYAITQGVHGQSYGHYAIDIAAGKGATILSPINGTVTQHYFDQWGNPTLVIENDYYQVMMLHGEYTAPVGTPVRLGQAVGTESNIGYTMDMLGRLCTNRDCGYHTHLNVFDKRVGTNVDPLARINPTGVGGQ
jgi:murein DD-endopeptidase MepM/ murein hydrolase activator NlpD